ncbi:kinesin-like protein KIF9 isoform X2 [Paramacrobiotus metropolitanus]|uniref:kinesin-like protein KIF9 isoform X2 n=1 Tax=Paramacrobiotus metropolitanus TaxID=2943436 RepID=UPI00244564ED|nr:kinesin-like protein KIF9 isoform X2 [Paramacrobiotus metropolitanus]
MAAAASSPNKKCVNKVLWNILHSKSQPLRAPKKKPFKRLPHIPRKNFSDRKNVVIAASGNYNVLCRIRPSTHFDPRALVVDDKEKIIRIAPPSKPYSDPSGVSEVVFRGIQCVYGGTQRQIYNDVLKRHFIDALDGFSSVVLLCGANNSGKTFSAVGEENFDFRGMIPRGIQDVFSEIHGRNADYDVSISMSCFDMIGNTLVDLLAAEAVGTMTIRSYHNLSYVKEVGYTRVRDEEEALFALYTTESKLLTIPTFKVSKVSIIRLGSFTSLQDKPHISMEQHGMLLDMNKTLGHLEQVIKSRTQKHNGAHSVSCRQTRLAHLMQDILTKRSSSVYVMACISGDAAFLKESLATLQFASRLSGINCSPAEHSITDPKKFNTYLKEEAEMLKMELRMYDLLNGREALDYSLKSKNRDVFHTAREVKNFVEGRIAMPKFATLKQLEEFMGLLKRLAKDGDIPTDPPDMLDLPNRETTQIGVLEIDADGKSSPPKELLDIEGVGDLDEREGTGVGTPGSTVKGKNVKPLMKKKKDDKKEEKTKLEKMSVVTPKKNGKENTSGKKKEREASKDASAISPGGDVPVESQRKGETNNKTDQKPTDTGAESPKLDSSPEIRQGLPDKNAVDVATPGVASNGNPAPKCFTKSEAFQAFAQDVPSAMFLKSEITKTRANLIQSEKDAEALVDALNKWIDELETAKTNYDRLRSDRLMYRPQNTGETPVVTFEEFKNNKKIKYLRNLIETGYKDIESAKNQLSDLRENLSNHRKKMFYEFEDWFSRTYVELSAKPVTMETPDLPANNNIAVTADGPQTNAELEHSGKASKQTSSRDPQIFCLREHPFASVAERYRHELAELEDRHPEAVVFNRALNRVRAAARIRQQNHGAFMANGHSKLQLDSSLKIGEITTLPSTLAHTS